MENQGATVTACNPASFDQWDIVPYATTDSRPYIENRKEVKRRVRNAFWLSHAAHQSKVRLRLCSVYDIPADVSSFDITTFGSVLLHVRDPFLALLSAAQHTTRAIIVTEIVYGPEMSAEAQDLIRPRPASEPLTHENCADLSRIVGGEFAEMPPKMHLIPRFKQGFPINTWWRFNPTLIQEFLGILGFEMQSVSYHYQVFNPKYQWANPVVDGEPSYFPLFTLVAQR